MPMRGHRRHHRRRRLNQTPWAELSGPQRVMRVIFFFIILAAAIIMGFYMFSVQRSITNDVAPIERPPIGYVPRIDEHLTVKPTA